MSEVASSHLQHQFPGKTSNIWFFLIMLLKCVFISPTSNPSPPTSPAYPGNAPPPMHNIAISAATIPDIYTVELPQPHSFRSSSKIRTYAPAPNLPPPGLNHGRSPIAGEASSLPITVPLFLPHTDTFRPATSPPVSLSSIQKVTLLISTNNLGGPWTNGSFVPKHGFI
jgi:hypothetical protein